MHLNQLMLLPYQMSGLVIILCNSGESRRLSHFDSHRILLTDFSGTAKH